MASDDVTETVGAVQPSPTYASICSGIEAVSVAWHPLGYQCLWLAEIDKAASALLRHHYPDIPNHGDLLTLADRVTSGELPAPDILIGGTPCQSFSVAGLRKGMSDPRGALTMAFVRLCDAIDSVRAARGKSPVLIVWENVPGVLTHKENPFGCFLGAIAGESVPLVPPGGRWTHAGYVSGPSRTIAWRVLDAQYFGLAQRRNRTFVVASADSRIDPGSILFESEGVRRDSPPSRTTGQGIVAAVAPSLTGSGRGVERSGESRGQDPVIACSVSPSLRADANSTGGDRTHGTDVDTVNSLIAVPQWWDGRDVAQTLDAVLSKGQTMPEKNRFPAVLQPVAFDARQQNVIEYGERASPLDTDGYSQAIYFGTTQVTHRANRSNPQPGDACHPLASEAHAPVIAFSSKDHGADALQDCAPTHGASGHDGSHSNGGAPPAICVTGSVTHALRADGFDGSEDGTGRGQPIVPAVAFTASELSNGFAWEKEIYGTLDTSTPNDNRNIQRGVRVGMMVRRLLPVECERLQGFPDHYTLAADVRNRPRIQADGPRYKQLGNSMAVPVIAWLGRRILSVWPA